MAKPAMEKEREKIEEPSASAAPSGLWKPRVRLPFDEAVKRFREQSGRNMAATRREAEQEAKLKHKALAYSGF